MSSKKAKIAKQCKPILIVKVGSEEKPAGPTDTDKVKEDLEKLLREEGINVALYVTHHAIDMQLIWP